MSHRRCCCVGGCEVFIDDFNRANTTSPASVGEWIVHSGVWEIDTNELAEDGTNGLVYTTDSVYGTPRRYVSVICKDIQLGKIFRLAFAVDADGLSYYYVEYEVTASDPATNGWVRIGKSTFTEGSWVDGSVIDEKDVGKPDGGDGDDVVLLACVAADGFYAGVDFSSWPLWDCTVPSGPRAGIANVGDAAEYDDFRWHRHALDILPTIDANCPYCQCECEGYCIPRILTLTLQSTCSNRNGFTITLNIDESAYPAYQWIGTGDLTNPADDPPQTTNVDALFTCNHADCSDPPFSLCLDGFGGGCSTETWASGSGVTCIGAYASGGECVSAYTCSPLNLQFGPSLCSVSDWGSCTETWIVTE